MFNHMASKIDPFRAEVFEQLHGYGLSYRSVCGYLLDKGVEVSPQALRSWHLRRSRKISSRGTLIPQDLPNSQTRGRVSSLPAARTQPVTTAPKAPIAIPDQAVIRISKLKHRIEEQEQRLSATPFSPGCIGFLLKPKC